MGARSDRQDHDQGDFHVTPSYVLIDLLERKRGRLLKRLVKTANQIKAVDMEINKIEEMRLT